MFGPAEFAATGVVAAAAVVVGSAVFNDTYSVADSVGMLRASLQQCPTEDVEHEEV